MDYQWNGVDMSAVQQIMAAFSALSGASDPDFASVTLLLHGDGTNGSTTFTDSSSVPKTVTVSGSTISTSSPKFGTGSMQHSGGYAEIPYGTGAVKLTTVSDFTIEFWMRASGAQSSSQSGIWQQDTGSGGYTGLLISANTARQVQFTGSADLASWTHLLQTIGTYMDNVWHHVAVTRSGSTLRGFFDGVKTLEISAPTLGSNTATSWTGKYETYPFTGFIDDLRLTKGVCRYTASFTPPTVAFPNS